MARARQGPVIRAGHAARGIKTFSADRRLPAMTVVAGPGFTI